MDHAHFSNNKIRISGEPERYTLVFFSSTTPEKPTMKYRLDVCGKLPHSLFDLENNSTFEPNLTSAEGYCRAWPSFRGYRLYLPLKN